MDVGVLLPEQEGMGPGREKQQVICSHVLHSCCCCCCAGTSWLLTSNLEALCSLRGSVPAIPPLGGAQTTATSFPRASSTAQLPCGVAWVQTQYYCPSAHLHIPSGTRNYRFGLPRLLLPTPAPLFWQDPGLPHILPRTAAHSASRPLLPDAVSSHLAGTSPLCSKMLRGPILPKSLAPDFSAWHSETSP